MRILITGASGLLGLNLALEASREHKVYGLVNSHSLSTQLFTVLQNDLLVPGTAERLLERTQPDWVIHCAALANLDACEADPIQAQQINTEIPSLLAQNVARGGARLLHVSTDAVFDGSKGSYSEDDLPNPIGVYARTKLAAERVVAEQDPAAIIARVNLFGFSLGGRRSLSEFFLNNLQEKKPVMGFTDVFFCPLLVNHLAKIFLDMLANNLSGLYHVVSSECLSKYEFGLRIASKFNLDRTLVHPVSVAQSGLKAARSPNLTLRTGKLAQALGEPPPSVDAGLDALYQLYQQGYPKLIQTLSAVS